MVLITEVLESITPHQFLHKSVDALLLLAYFQYFTCISLCDSNISRSGEGRALGWEVGKKGVHFFFAGRLLQACTAPILPSNLL